MMRFVTSLLCSLVFAASGSAQASDCQKTEAACVLDAAWSASLILPLEKQERLAPAFLEIAVLSEQPDLIEKWESRFGQSARPAPSYPDYGWQRAGPIIREHGVDGLIEVAMKRQDPLSFGRADVLLSAGIRLRDEDPAAALRLNEALFSLITTASSFEKPNLAHAAAELAMSRCDMDLLSRAVALTDAPKNLRYAFWRARLTGGIDPLISRVRSIENDEDTRDVRRVLDGYRAILEFGYCAQSQSSIGD